MTERLDSPLRREQIADAALDIVVRHGIGAVTVRRVAEAVGISAAALYRHYKNKAEILKAVMEEHQEFFMVNVRLARAEGTGPLDTIRRLYLSSMTLVERYCALPVVFLSDVLWFEETQLRDLKLKHHKILRDIIIELITAAQQKGEIRTDIRPEEIFVHFIGLIAMPALIQARTPHDLDMPRQTTANWELFAHAVAA
ncbi:TetR family transcriptional regulator [Desulfovibrio aerotolerans]|uniref:TetR family transcriptional regulator n=1 Tax=Solidesulfovibrio aerotolerans TaxID=295255 RepID=A0A7C9ILQ8_9BACT|nr:TetR/AcrR family transcriptional regulator [Solidesulfovibrio aerotolerans]MYL81999.1 TetR family transcriptional regulator [Solidesulfovibrio aerotolerans]